MSKAFTKETDQDEDSPDEATDREEGEIAAAAATNLDPGEDRYKEQYGVIVICDGEAMQKKIFDDLVGRGLNVRIVVT